MNTTISPETAYLENPWRNAYWFSRMLINNDKYGGIGKKTSVILAMASALRSILENGDNISESDVVEISKTTIHKLLVEHVQKAKALTERVQLLCEDLNQKLSCRTDIEVLILACEQIVVPISLALKEIPSNDREFTEVICKAFLDNLGTEGLAKVINLWDDLGVQGCLDAERTLVVKEFGALRHRIQHLDESVKDLVLTAFIQEFERRLGQKRKGRAGGSLEDVTSFLFTYFGIRASDRPEHFQADIEVDKWIKTRDNWLIGISCKRTLRERWKQVSSANQALLGQFKIKELWHVITYDEDLSDDKITLLGAQRHVFYLRDDSRRYLHAKQHIGMKDYVRPITQFIKDIQQNQGK